MSGGAAGTNTGKVIPLPRRPRSTGRATPSEADAQAARASAERAERRRAAWLRESGIIAAGHLIDGALLLMLAVTGAVHWAAALLHAVPGSIACALAVALIAGGHSQHWKDPALSNALAFVSMATCGLGIVVYPEVSFLYVLILLSVFLGASYRMPRAWINLSCCGASVSIGLLTLVGDSPLQIPAATTAQQLVAGACCAALLAQGVVLSKINSDRVLLLRSLDQQMAGTLAQIEQLANFDELTRLPNRRNVLRTLDDELARSARDGSALTVARLGLDHFKAINETRGHLAGDGMLQAFAAAVQAHRRGTDAFGRLSGAEFLLILPTSSIHDARLTMEHLRNAVATTLLNDATPDLHFTFSFGLATWQAGDTAEALLTRADNALHGVTHAGRDCFHAG